MKVYRDVVENGIVVKKEIFDIIECTYTGKFMGERSISATINFASPIDFRIGDYIEMEMQSLVRGANEEGLIGYENGEFYNALDRFYIYTMPTIKKTASRNTHGQGFEHTVIFYPAQYELACVQMRDMGNSMSADSIIYTGFDTVTFYGGAFELMERIMEVLKASYRDSEGKPLWSYEIADAINEQKNTALERFAFNFSGNTVMDALLKLSDKEGINTTFFINNRKIYVGFKRPYFCRVTGDGTIDTALSTQMFSFRYGKTSHKNPAINYGGLCDITKTIGQELPITKLFAYGASRNLNRYYCSDRIAGGRYVNRVMLPSFDMDGKTDYIVSEDAAKKYGIREGSKQFEDIYPTLRYMTYGDLRAIKYTIKVKASGLESDNINNPSYNVARVQCYKVVEGNNGVNTLVEAAPPDDLAIYVHAEGKIVKVVLYGGLTNEDAIEKQRMHDSRVPTRTVGGTDYIPGACFLVHDDGFGGSGALHRDKWFDDPEGNSYTQEEKDEIKLHQIKYTDTFWLTDLYVFQSYSQSYFSRDGYSAWAWPRLNSNYTTQNGSVASDAAPVNTILGVEPITIIDTSMTAADLDKQQKTFDIYLGDTGFKIDEQNDFGEMVFVVAGTVKVSILDGMLTGREFEVNGAVTDSQFSCICAYNDDGTKNDDFFKASDYSGEDIPQKAFENGAIWRLRLNRMNLDEPDYSNLNIAIPNNLINASAGDHLVLLDIFMPDIYIHAAENRLLREARKYLDANDNGTVNYAVNFDKVRMHQVPLYALQIREGLNIRMEDEDLNIQTENNGRFISDYREKPLMSSIPVNAIERQWEYTQDYVSATASVTASQLIIEVVLQYSENWLNNPIRIVQNGNNYNLGMPRRTEFNGWSTDKGGYVYALYYQLPNGIDFTSEYQIYRNSIVKGDIQKVWLSSNQAVDFTKGRYYTVDVRVKDNGYVDYENISFSLFNVKNDSNISYTPSNIKVTHGRKDGESYLYLSLEFYLDEGFNDGIVYYPSIQYTCDGREADVTLHLISIYEQDYIDNSKILPYADFTLDSVTIKIYDSSNRTNAQPVKEISATLSEQNNATAWASLMNRVETTEKESHQNKLTWEEIVNVSRRHYQTLLNLRNSIFDPDGKCDQTFLQVMMLQVGADSMNYQLRNTRVGLTYKGHVAFFNCSCVKGEDGFFHFIVENPDVLDHFVFTDGDNNGTWTIPVGIDAVLTPNEDGTYPTYFVSIKCPIDGSDAQWVCEPIQRKVNEDSTCWYFNWGIIIADGDTYTLTETRGNAYMYGDNLVCGKISDISKRSYFDLTRGEFALGMNDDETAALKYVDGVLTINGFPSEERVAELIGIATNQQIGGDNLIAVKNPYEIREKAEEGDSIYMDRIILTSYSMSDIGIEFKMYPAGDYVFSAEDMYCDALSPDSEEVSGTSEIALVAISSIGAVNASVNINKGKSDSVIITTTEECYFALRVEVNDFASGSTIVAKFTNMMLQGGTKSTAYNNFVQHLTDAFEGSTDIAGGLVATSLINLRDKDGMPTAGLSGLKDNDQNCYGVAMFAGGSYLDALEQATAYAQGTVNELSKILPILLTKVGVGSKVGCFEVVSVNQAAIYNSDRSSRILLSATDEVGSLSIKLQTLDGMSYKDKIIISDESIDDSIEYAVYSGSPAGVIVNDEGEQMPETIETVNSVTISGDGWECSMNSKQYIYLDMLVRTGAQIKQLHLGSNSKLQLINISTGTIAMEKSIAGLQAANINKDGTVMFIIPLFDTEGLRFAEGEYKLQIVVNTYVRTNSAGVSYTEHYYNERFTNGIISFYLSHDLYFTRNISVDNTSLIRIGRDGVKIAASSSSNFIVKNNNESNMSVIINGLPDSANGLPSGSLYRSGNTLMIC